MARDGSGATAPPLACRAPEFQLWYSVTIVLNYTVDPPPHHQPDTSMTGPNCSPRRKPLGEWLIDCEAFEAVPYFEPHPPKYSSYETFFGKKKSPLNTHTQKQKGPAKKNSSCGGYD